MTLSGSTEEQVPIRVLGGPTTLIEYGGLRLLTDPTFDPVGEYPLGEMTLVKTIPAPVSVADVGPVDVVLLSHDQHPDNLDTSGRAMLANVSLVLTTPSGAERLGGTARGMQPWDAVELDRPHGGTVTVTAAPALHGPEGSQPLVGDVIGFVLSGEDLPTVYVSGDNASLDRVREVAGRFPVIDTAVLFAGAARIPAIDDILTLDGARAAQAAAILGARRVVPAHCDSWSHFSEGLDQIVTAFTSAGIADRLRPD